MKTNEYSASECELIAKGRPGRNLNKKSLRRAELETVFIHAATFILIVFGSIKILSALGSAEILGTPHPIFPTTHRHVYFLTGLVEVMIVMQVVRADTAISKIVPIFLISACFGLFRLAYWLWVPGKSCGCFGNALSWLSITANTGDVIAKYAFYFLMSGSTILVIRSIKNGSLRG